MGAGMCNFIVEHTNDGSVKLKSVKHGSYIAVRNGQVVTGAGGPFCKLHIYR